MTPRRAGCQWCYLMLAGVLLQGCLRRSPAEQALTAPAQASIPAAISESQPQEPPPPGQLGPTPELIANLSQAPLSLSARRTEDERQDGERLWKLELHQDDRRLASWEAVSGFASSQSLDRRWSPGNGAPLPSGNYALGLPEALGDDIWLTLTPRFETTRSGLGIHGCNPGSGCVCLPDRTSLEALASWVKTFQIQSLTVVN